MAEGPRPVFYVSPKDPGEIIPITIDFNPQLAAGESFGAGVVTVSIYDRETGGAESAMLVPSSIGVSNNHPTFKVRFGSDNHDYVGQVEATVSATRIARGDVIIPVRIRPRANPGAPQVP